MNKCQKSCRRFGISQQYRKTSESDKKWGMAVKVFTKYWWRDCGKPFHTLNYSLFFLLAAGGVEYFGTCTEQDSSDNRVNVAWQSLTLSFLDEMHSKGLHVFGQNPKDIHRNEMVEKLCKYANNWTTMLLFFPPSSSFRSTWFLTTNPAVDIYLNN